MGQITGAGAGDQPQTRDTREHPRAPGDMSYMTYQKNQNLLDGGKQSLAETIANIFTNNKFLLWASHSKLLKIQQ